MSSSFSKNQRILRSSEFTRVIRRGRCAADQTLVVYALAMAPPTVPPPISRIGVTIPKKAGGAVVRNKWKRLIREAFRTQQDSIPVGFDYVVRPKKGAEPVWSEVKDAIPRLTRRATKNKSVIADAVKPPGSTS